MPYDLSDLRNKIEDLSAQVIQLQTQLETAEGDRKYAEDELKSAAVELKRLDNDVYNLNGKAEASVEEREVARHVQEADREFTLNLIKAIRPGAALADLMVGVLPTVINAYAQYCSLEDKLIEKAIVEPPVDRPELRQFCIMYLTGLNRLDLLERLHRTLANYPVPEWSRVVTSCFNDLCIEEE